MPNLTGKHSTFESFMATAKLTMASEADTIRILVASDNHVGFNERDPQRGDDSWRTFDEIMTLAKTRDVDMVLLAGDLFHENKPSRNSMYQVLRSLRKNCLGEKPCELEFLGDGSEVFGGFVPPLPFIHVSGANRGKVHLIMSITRTLISMLRFQSFQFMGIMMILLERVILQHWICFKFPGW
jgi:hypothetical protein